MITIRPARPEDADTVIALANGLNQYEGKPDTPLTADQFRESAFGAAPWFECLIAECRDRAVGYAAYSRDFDLESGQRGLHLIDLFVAAEVRRRGVGRALLARLTTTALSMGCAYIEWQAMNWNAEAQAFYRAVGGVEEGVQTYSMGLAELEALCRPRSDAAEIL
ncbi:MAG TPA: GNAT family N-acetyltransferase [Alphaproteobacteria bacterium]|nr:GNAT family N-acetyltransferase [Alphaproteobacteria bacterium]